jgi:23S rRNA pseudouridine1911/1915/1917 synthase
MNIEVLFENNHLLVINKPSGLVVHSDGKTDEPTVVDWILEHYPDIQGVGEDMNIGDLIISRPGIVHRIDRDTSGCLVIAKTQESFEHIKQQFKDRKVQKTYQALVYGNIKKDSGEITEPIGKSKKDFRMKMAGRGARGTLRDALTEFAVLKRLEDATSVDKQGQTLKYTLVELKPKTGRTHQLRVHLKYINHPIVSDSLYRTNSAPRTTH